MSNGIGDDGAAALAGSTHLPALRGLHLQNDQVADAGVHPLVILALDPAAQLRLEMNSISEEGVGRLKERFGDCVHF